MHGGCVRDWRCCGDCFARAASGLCGLFLCIVLRLQTVLTVDTADITTSVATTMTTQDLAVDVTGADAYQMTCYPNCPPTHCIPPLLLRGTVGSCSAASTFDEFVSLETPIYLSPVVPWSGRPSPEPQRRQRLLSRGGSH